MKTKFVLPAIDRSNGDLALFTILANDAVEATVTLRELLGPGYITAKAETTEEFVGRAMEADLERPSFVTNTQPSDEQS